MRIGLSALLGVTGGPSTYASKLAAALARRDDVDLCVITDRPERFPDSIETRPLKFRGGLDRLRWQYLALGSAVKRAKVDLFHDTKNALPFGLRVPAVVTVHDLAYHRFPETFPRGSRIFLQRATQHAVARARRVVVPSEWTAQELRRVHPHTEGRIDVAPHGIDTLPEPEPGLLQQVRLRYGLPDRFVLHTGTVQARKNVDLLVRSARRARQDCPDLRLIVVGRRGWHSEAAFDEIERDDTARWLGELPFDELCCVYRLASAFASPSADEGFGFTVADALALGLPTAVSDQGSLPEVVGQAALQVPIDEQSFAECLVRLWSDASTIERLRGAGPARAAQFDWELAAEATVASYSRALGLRGSRRVPT